MEIKGFLYYFDGRRLVCRNSVFLIGLGRSIETVRYCSFRMSEETNRKVSLIRDEFASLLGGQACALRSNESQRPEDIGFDATMSDV